MRIAIVACSNGLGHIKRILKILHCLLSNNFYLRADLIFAHWQFKKLQNWIVLQEILKSPNVHYFEYNFPVIWNHDETYYGKWLVEWHKEIEQFNLDSYSLVLSDNLIEPLIYSDNCILIGSFLWHKILTRAYPENHWLDEYKLLGDQILKKYSNDIIVNKHFVMPEVKKHYDTFDINAICFTPTIQEKKITPKKNILIALGNTDDANKLINDISPILPILKDNGFKIFCSNEIYSLIAKYYENAILFDFEKNILSEIDLAIIRAGIGSISDCIAAKIPMAFVEEKINPEIKFNQEILINLGIGISLRDIVNNEDSFISSNSSYKKVVNNISKFKVGGEYRAAEYITDKTGG